MARRAPAVERAVAILNHLAAHPDRPYTLSEIARELRLNKATLHAILSALTASGYLARDPERKSYTLGPALVALGNSATEAYPAAHYAMPEMQAVTDELGLDCVASAAIGVEIVILARAGTPRPFGINIEPGMRMPLVPPLGTVFVAWSQPEEIEKYLARVGPAVSKDRLERYRRAVAVVRERGYSVGVEGGEAEQVFRRLRGETPEDDRPRRGKRLSDEDYALLEMNRAAAYRVNHIGVPVFGPDAEVALGLFLIGFHDQLPAGTVPRYAERLRTAAANVTKAIHGREPEFLPA